MDKAEVDYIQGQITGAQPLQVQRSLQRLSKLYRDGFRVPPDRIGPLHNALCGLVITRSSEKKVLRWALNSLAQLGKGLPSDEAIRYVLANRQDDPESIAAAIAALFKVCRDPSAMLATLHFDPQMVTLAALQHVAPDKLDTSYLPLQLDKTTPDLLKLALILVGLARAPQTLFHPKHSNDIMVKAVGRHHDPIVVQYSIWAITENPKLTVSSLGLPLKDYDSYPENVRAWLLQLLGMRPVAASRNFDLLAAGAGDPSPAVRAGLALGIRETYIDGLDPIVLDWFSHELDPEVMQLLLDHLVRNSDRSTNYKQWALAKYSAEMPGSALRTRMELIARGHQIGSEFRSILAQQQPDIFGGYTHVAGDQITVGSMQGGANSLRGNARNSGETNIQNNAALQQAVDRELAKAERELRTAGIDEEIRNEALEQIEIARKTPTTDNLSKVVDVLGRVDSVLSNTAKVGTALGTAAMGIAKLVGLG